jgi:hypothetical protein
MTSAPDIGQGVNPQHMEQNKQENRKTYIYLYLPPASLTFFITFNGQIQVHTIQMARDSFRVIWLCYCYIGHG